MSLNKSALVQKKLLNENNILPEGGHSMNEEASKKREEIVGTLKSVYNISTSPKNRKNTDSYKRRKEILAYAGPAPKKEDFTDDANGYKNAETAYAEKIDALKKMKYSPEEYATYTQEKNSFGSSNKSDSQESAELSDAEYLQHIPASQNRIKKYFLSMTPEEKEAVKKVVKYTAEGIDVLDKEGKIIAQLEYEDIKVDTVILGKGEEKTGKDRGKYISYDAKKLKKQDDEYYDPIIEEQDGVVFGSFEGWKRYTAAAAIVLPSDDAREAMVKQMPAGDYTSRGYESVAGLQLHRLLGGQLSGYRYVSIRHRSGEFGALWSGSRNDDNSAWALRSNFTQGEVNYYYRYDLFPARALRTPKTA